MLLFTAKKFDLGVLGSHLNKLKDKFGITKEFWSLLPVIGRFQNKPPYLLDLIINDPENKELRD